MLYNKIQYNTIQMHQSNVTLFCIYDDKPMQYCQIQCNKILYNTIQHNALKLQYNAIHMHQSNVTLLCI